MCVYFEHHLHHFVLLSALCCVALCSLISAFFWCFEVSLQEIQWLGICSVQGCTKLPVKKRKNLCWKEISHIDFDSMARPVWMSLTPSVLARKVECPGPTSVLWLITVPHIKLWHCAIWWRKAMVLHMFRKLHVTLLTRLKKLCFASNLIAQNWIKVLNGSWVMEHEVMFWSQMNVRVQLQEERVMLFNDRGQVQCCFNSQRRREDELHTWQ